MDNEKFSCKMCCAYNPLCGSCTLFPEDTYEVCPLADFEPSAFDFKENKTND